MFENIVISEVEETVTEMRIVRATIAFEMVDGKCTDESLQPLYDKLCPVVENPAEEWKNNGELPTV